MNKLKLIKNILVFFLCTIGYNHSFAQTTMKLSKIEIDSILNSRLNNHNKRDTLFSLDRQTKFYKKFLGFIKIKNGEGITLDYTVYIDNKLFMYFEYSKKFRKSKIEEWDYEYYFIENRLVKYKTTRFLKRKNKENWEVKHRVDLYFNGNEVIDKKLEINDKFSFSKINLELVFQEAKRIDKELDTKKPSR